MAETVGGRLRGLWQAWVSVARRIGNFQARVVLTVLYVVALFPFGVCVRLFADTLRTKERPSQWLNRPPEIIDMPWAHKQ
jgi:hypothetical protein